MSLDLFQVVPQIEAMTAGLKEEEERHQQCLRKALDTLSTVNLDELKQKLGTSRTTWLVAGLLEGLAGAKPLPRRPEDFYAIATDGSHIDVDRHHATGCCLINIGNVTLRYGGRPDALISSFPTLYFQQDELAISRPGQGNREETLRGPLLGVKRSVEECRWLARCVEGTEPGVPVLALLDGSLILWSLAAGKYSDFVVEEFLEKGMVKHLDCLRELGQKRPLVVASHISFPGSTEVVNALRVAVCPHEPVDCDRFCSGESPQGGRECDEVAGIADRELFARILAPGQRSDVFVSRSSIVQKYYGRHEVCFFYLRVQDEIARVELPRWVVEGGLVDLAHALVFDQCERGQGYPVALSEAHERAVITGSDREYFWEMVDGSMAREGFSAQGSAKSRSKRTRWI